MLPPDFPALIHETYRQFTRQGGLYHAAWVRLRSYIVDEIRLKRTAALVVFIATCEAWRHSPTRLAEISKLRYKARAYKDAQGSDKAENIRNCYRPRYIDQLEDSAIYAFVKLSGDKTIKANIWRGLLSEILLIAFTQSAETVTPQKTLLMINRIQKRFKRLIGRADNLDTVFRNGRGTLMVTSGIISPRPRPQPGHTENRAP